MTEEEAKTKWCPFGRGAFVGNHDQLLVVNRDLMGGASDECRCIGSACMAWRWDEELTREAKRGMGELTGAAHGHCGLAGKP